MRTKWNKAAALAVLVAVAGGVARAQYGEMPQWPKRPKREPPKVAFDSRLPSLGMTLRKLPAGAGKPIVEASCLLCHSADMLMQQRLSEKQWTREVDRMMGWGCVLTPEKKATLVAFLAKNFGPENQSFQPIESRPAGY